MYAVSQCPSVLSISNVPTSDLCHCHDMFVTTTSSPPGHHDSLAPVFNAEEIVLYERLTKVSPCDHNNRVPCWVYSCKHPVLTQPKHPAGGSALCTGGVLYITVRHCTVQQGGPVQYGTRASHGSQLTPDWPPVRSVEITAETRKYFIWFE